MGRLLTDVFALNFDASGTAGASCGAQTQSKGSFPRQKTTTSNPSTASSVLNAYTPHRYISSNHPARPEQFDEEDLDLFPYQGLLVSSSDSTTSSNDEEIEDDEDNDGYHHFKSISRGTTADLTIYRCPDCQTDICHSSSVISTDFWGSHGKAYLVSSVLNVHLDSMDTRQMRTGNYGVKAIHCIQCNKNLGWKYCVSESSREQYKIGKYVIEKNIMSEFPI